MKIQRIENKGKKTTKCQRCGASVSLKQMAEYHLETVGLQNVWLLNISEYTCNECKNHSVLIPDFGLLMLIICQSLVFKNDSYTSQELRFMLKYFGIKGKNLADILGTNSKTVSFWLNGKSSISPSYGIKLRKYLIERLFSYISERTEKYKYFKEKVKEVVKELKEEKQENYKKYLQEQARLAVRKKLLDFEMINGSDAPTCKVPYSETQVQLRY